MKCSIVSSRTLKVSELPSKIEGLKTLPTEIEIEICYTGDPNAQKAVVLDNAVIPAIQRALSFHDELRNTIMRLLNISLSDCNEVVDARAAAVEVFFKSSLLPSWRV